MAAIKEKAGEVWLDETQTIKDQSWENLMDLVRNGGMAACPHCGAAPPTVRVDSELWVTCDLDRGGCGAIGPPRGSASAAVEAWNRRIPHPNGCACAPCRAKVM